GDWHLTARLAGPTIRSLHWANSWAMLAGIFNVSARALCETDPKAAAMIQGAARSLALAITPASSADSTSSSTDNPAALIIETRRATTRLLNEALGNDLLRELRERGAALHRDDAIGYMLARLDEFLARGDV